MKKHQKQIFIFLSYFFVFGIGFIISQQYTPEKNYLREAKKVLREKDTTKQEKLLKEFSQSDRWYDIADKEGQIYHMNYLLSLSLAKEYIDRQMWNLAANSVKQAEKILPHDFDMALQGAIAYTYLYEKETSLSKQDEIFKNAKKYIELALSVQPENRDVLYVKGSLAIYRGIYDIAISSFKTNLENYPNDVDSALALARAYYENNNFLKAKQVYEQLENTLDVNSQKMIIVQQNLAILNKMNL